MKLRNHRDEAPLSARVVAVLLRGWSASRGMSEPRHDDGLFALFMGRESTVAALWRQHEPYLRAEAARLQIEPEHELRGRPAYFGEVYAQEGGECRS